MTGRGTLLALLACAAASAPVAPAQAAPRRQTVLATGDSMVQVLDGLLAQRLERKRGVHVLSDAHISTGISKPSLLDWPRHSAWQAHRYRPRATVMFLGANDGFPMPTPSGARVDCCGRAWQAEYARRVRAMMATYARRGRGRVYWLLLPQARSGFFRRIYPAVNAAIERAARALRHDVRIVHLNRLFTPHGRYRDKMSWHGRVVDVRQSDGVHLSRDGAAIAAAVVARRMLRDHVFRRRAREAATNPPAGKAVTLTWVGDMAFSSRAGLPRGGPRAAFAPMRRALRRADLTVGNLEGALGSGGPSKCGGLASYGREGGPGRQVGNCFAFQAPAWYARGFRQAGFGLVNLANNHSRDFGQTGLRQTRAALARAQLAHTGLAGEITVRKLGGIRVAFLGFAPYPWASSLLDIPAARRQVAASRRRAQIVVVMMHAGAEGVGALHVPHGTETAFGENRGQTRRFTHAVVDAGADAVLGSGPHVLRGFECYRRRLIAYSLGNFAGFHTLSTAGILSLSGVLRLSLRPRGALLEARLSPARLTPSGLPRRERGGVSVRLVRQLSHQDFGGRACRVGRRGAVSLP